MKTAHGVKFESTGVQLENGKMLWRKIDKKTNQRTNKFAEQFRPDLPWAYGTWFLKIDTEWVLNKYPELEIK